MAFDIMQMLRGIPNMLTQQGQGAPNMLAQPAGQMPMPQQQQMPAPQPQQGGGFMNKVQGFSRSPIGQNIQNAMLGWAQGGTVQDSLGKGAQMVAMGRKERQGDTERNQTVEWLKSKGMDDNQAKAIAGNPAVLTDVLKTMLDPNAALDTEFKRAQIENIQSQIEERNDPSVRDQFGLNPIYGKDANGNLVVMQPSKAGGLVKADIPEGVTLQPGTDKIDLGTGWGITDRSGSIISVIPKDLAGAEAEKAVGAKQGDAQFDLPRVEQNAAQTLGVLERMKTHPGRAGSTGFIQGVLPSRSSDQVDFQSLVDQTQGQSFLQAFQMLKGAGQITEIEGTKATDAISRLRNQRLGDEDYLRAITDLEDVIKAGLARAKVQAGSPAQTNAPAAPAAGGVVDYTDFFGGQ